MNTQNHQKSKFVHIFLAYFQFEQIICKSIFRIISKKSIDRFSCIKYSVLKASPLENNKHYYYTTSFLHFSVNSMELDVTPKKCTRKPKIKKVSCRNVKPITVCGEEYHRSLLHSLRSVCFTFIRQCNACFQI